MSAKQSARGQKVASTGHSEFFTDLQRDIQQHSVPTYRRSVDKSIFKLGVAREELLVQEGGVFHIAEEGEIDSVRRRHMLELYRFDGHGEKCD